MALQPAEMVNRRRLGLVPTHFRHEGQPWRLRRRQGRECLRSRGEVLRVVVQEEYSRPGRESFCCEHFATGDLQRCARD